MTPEIDRAFRESVGTFRRMSVAESNAAKPLHLKVVTVAEGDTVEKLASRMACPTGRSSASACSTDWARASGSRSARR